MNAPSFIGRTSNIAGHAIRSVVARDEPEQSYAHSLADLAHALSTPEAMAEKKASLRAIATTPDFHPGKPVPVGVVADVEGAVLPHMIGSDIGCGMRMVVLDNVTSEQLSTPVLDRHLRHVFFQGGRDIALTGLDRHAILREGLPGLLDSLQRKSTGLLSKLDLSRVWADLERHSDSGVFACENIDVDFADYAQIDSDHRRDAILGTIGGGNHFVELGYVDQVADGTFARTAGLKPGSVVLVVHSGSLDFGQRVGTATRDRLKSDFKPGEDWRVLSREMRPDLYKRYMNGHANAVNAAFANRFFIGLAAIEAVARTLGQEIEHRLVYDAPHNTVWESGSVVRHRKGACPARGVGALGAGPYEWLGEPVILPGSMGDGTWLLAGCGSTDFLESSAHGAGRKLSRQEARSRGNTANALRVIGPVDPQSPSLQGRQDILAEIHARLKEEAPAAYKPVDSVVEPMVDAGMVTKVAKITPLVTVKG
ncbi:tRNA-splicing ligase RtcB protein (plasmid) [Rhizobium sp. CIAT894]|uniref:RtcB family protein n=1 Tax=Rhizobium sp. CIAT894 TaxID=2020312 RepID=UPI000A1DC06E|nr:RtcB family protein [Rhizobium sp. CIAT894]ARM92061.1 tRNA-splicing ligase RtcB protein [Rhizobium sp. CIAT894]